MRLTLILLWAVVCVFPISLNAQQKGNAPPPAPAPSPGNKPNSTNVPQPSTNPQPNTPQNPNISIRGRIIAQGVRELPIVEIRFDSETGPPIGFTFSTSTGDFFFRPTNLQEGQAVYISFQIDGYKPYHERVGGIFDTQGFDQILNIFLEREDKARNETPGLPTVDVKQLRSRIPAKAVDEYEKALKDFTKGNDGSAMEHLERTVKLAPEFFEAQNALGRQYIKQKRYNEAETALLHAKELSPKASEPQANLGLLYYYRGEAQLDAALADEAAAAFQKARNFLEEAARLDPLSATTQSYFGAALYKTGSYQRAETVLNKALELDAEQQNARLMLINVYVKESRYDEALLLIKTYVVNHPKAPQRAELEAMQGQIEKINQSRNR